MQEPVGVDALASHVDEFATVTAKNS